MDRDPEELAREVSRLYWETDASVAEIANRLGISRRALYDALIPAPAGARCEICGGALVFTNRSGRMAGQAECVECGHTQDLALLDELAAEAGEAMPREPGRGEAGGESVPGALPAMEPAVEQEWDAAALSPIDAERAIQRDRLLLLGGAALAGLAVGAAVTLLLSRR